MNRIVLIGNGFDLAHGLKTKYSHFLFWHFKRCVINVCKTKSSYLDGKLFRIAVQPWQDLTSSVLVLNEINDYANFLSESRGIGLHIQFVSKIIGDEIEEPISSLNWVDIEYNFYVALRVIYNRYHYNKTPKYDRKSQFHNEIEQLNQELEYIKVNFVEYLKEINLKINNLALKRNLVEKLYEPIKTIDIALRYRLSIQYRDLKEILFLNFNYTNLIEKYLDEFRPDERIKVRHIHGQINDLSTIIFGYGDHYGSSYEDFENTFEKKYVEKAKYFGYLKSETYRDLINFIEKEEYEVYVIGHSLGMSDRTLLKALFENKKCVSIKLFYYKNERGEDDFDDKIMNASIHFKDKAEMLAKIMSKNSDFLFKIN